MVIPNPISEIRDFLAESTLVLSEDQRDPRTNSAANEDQIIDIIQSNFDISRPNMRAWYDFKSDFHGLPLPVNIKVSNFRGNDNLQCKLGIYHALTGMWPEFPNEISWGSFFAKLSQDYKNDANTDYYFIVVNKLDATDVVATSLKSLQSLVPNGNNLPFQCNWESNRVSKLRSHSDATKFILDNLRKSCDLRSRISTEFEEHLAKLI